MNAWTIFLQYFLNLFHHGLAFFCFEATPKSAQGFLLTALWDYSWWCLGVYVSCQTWVSHLHREHSNTMLSSQTFPLPLFKVFACSKMEWLKKTVKKVIVTDHKKSTKTCSSVWGLFLINWQPVTFLSSAEYAFCKKIGKVWREIFTAKL